MASMVCVPYLLVLMFIVHWFTAHKTFSARETFSERPTNRCEKKNCCKHAYQPTYFIIHKIKRNLLIFLIVKVKKVFLGSAPGLGDRVVECQLVLAAIAFVEVLQDLIG